MPLAKRRKASLGQEAEKSSENESRSPVQVGSPISPATGSMVGESNQIDNGNEEVAVGDTSSPSNKITVSISEKESSKRGRSKSLGEAILEVKMNEEALKPVRISERLSIKRNRIGDEEDGDLVASTPKKPKSSSNASKQPKKTSSSAICTSAGTSKAAESSAETSEKVVKKKKKIKKSFSPWSVEEMKLFFYYLGVYGKNIDAISEQISSIAKKKGIEPRTKCQVRFLYYRHVAKVSKILQIRGVMTTAQEVFSLINYGALWKYVKETNPQFPKCLKQLILKGRTSYSRVTGRNKRCGKLQTPMCTYLKEKVEGTQASDDEVCKLPTHVTIELTPKNSTAWSRVQELSQNPRVRFKLSTNRTLESVFKYLNSKWKSNNLRLKEAMGEKPEVSEDELIFHFHPTSEMTPFTLKPAKYQKRDERYKTYVEQVFPNLLSGSKETDQKEVASSKEKEQDEGKEIVQDTVRRDEESQSLVLESPVKNEPVEPVVENDKQRAASTENENDISNDKESKESVSGYVMPIPDSKNNLNNKEYSCQVFSAEKTNNFTLLKSEPCDKEEDTHGECTRDQYLDFTPNGNLTVVSKSLSQTQSLSMMKSSSSTSTSSSLSPSSSSSSSLPLKTKPQLSPSTSKDESSSAPTTSSTSTLSPSTLPSQSTVPSSSSSSPLSSSSKAISSPLRSLASALNLKPVLNLSPPPSSLSDSTSAKSLVSPHSNNKKGAKKKINFCDNNTTDSSSSSHNLFNDPNPNSDVRNQTTDSQSSKTNNDDAVMKEVNSEFERLHNLAKSGFLLSNSNTVTLSHLCLLFGRASVIRLEYEWVLKQESQAQNQHPLPAFCNPSNPIANSLRRLCHIAALELASFKFKNRQNFINKEKNKPETTEGVNDRIRKKVSVRNFGSMTDARITMLPPQAIPVLPAGKIIHHHSQSHPHHHHHHQNRKIDSTIQMNGVGGGEVFRVPVVPAYRPVMSKEEEEKLKLQQERANAIMQDCSMQRSRLLKRRNVRTARSKPIIVQRTLLPKVPNEGIITYIQPPASHSQVMVSNGPLDVSMPSISQALIATSLSLMACNTTVTTTNTIMTSLGGSIGDGQLSESRGSHPTMSLGNLPSVCLGSQSPEPLRGQPSVPLGTNILELAIESANIRASPVKDDSMSSLSSGDISHMTFQTTPPSTPLHPPLTLTSRENVSLSITDQSNISISDLDISLASASTSNMGPDAGDKFLDSVLERSQQGFSGLITPVVKSDRSTTPHQPPVIGLDSSLSAFDLSGMKTPPRSSSPSPIINSSPPSKVTNPDQSWMSGESADVSLSSILGVFSSFQGRQQEPKLKTPCKMSVMSQVSLFDQSSSDGVYNSITVAIPKSNFASVSFNALLGDPPLSSPVIKADDSQHANHQTDSNEDLTPLVAPPPSLFSEVSQDSLAKLDMDVTLQGMVNDSSQDLVSKFEKLAAQMAENRQEQEVVKPSLTVKHSGCELIKDNSSD